MTRADARFHALWAEQYATWLDEYREQHGADPDEDARADGWHIAQEEARLIVRSES